MPILTEQAPNAAWIESGESGELCCAGCADRVQRVHAESRRGPCCHNLPARWHQGSDGLYNSTSEDEPYDEEEGEEEEQLDPPHCRHCGSHTWTVTGTQSVDTSEDDETNGVTIYVRDDDFDDFTARCARCNMPMPREYELET